MNVRIISIDSCSSTPPTIAMVKEIALELGLKINFDHVIETQEEAQQYRHIGSPTVQIGGMDIDPDARMSTQFGVT